MKRVLFNREHRSISLAEGSEAWVEIIRVGDWSNSYKNFSLFREDIEKMVENFNDNVMRLDKGWIQFNFDHQFYEGLGAGWIKQLRLDGDVLLGLTEFTPRATKAIKDGEYRFVSAELDLNYIDDELIIAHGPTLTGAGLTNNPFVRAMKAVALSDQKRGDSEIYLFSNETVMEQLKEKLQSLLEQDNVSQDEYEAVKAEFEALEEKERAEISESFDKLGGMIIFEGDKDEEAEEAEAEEAKEEPVEDEPVVEEDSEVEEAATEEVKASDDKVSLTDAQKEIKSLKLQLAEEKKLSTKKQKELDARNHQIRKTEVKLSVDNLLNDGKVTPAQTEELNKFLLSIAPEKSNALLDIIGNGAVKIHLSEKGGVSGEAISLTKSEFAAKHKEETEKVLSEGKLTKEQASQVAIRNLKKVYDLSEIN